MHTLSSLLNNIGVVGWHPVFVVATRIDCQADLNGIIDVPFANDEQEVMGAIELASWLLKG